MHNVMSQTAVPSFFASVIAFTTWYVRSLASFCQEGSESSAITCQIVCINTIIFISLLFIQNTHAY